MRQLKDFLEMKPFDANAYKSYLREIKVERFVISYILLKDNKILRTRINDECMRYTKVKDISYPPEDKARTDRASLEGRPMFYGSIFTHQSSQVFLPRIISLIETSAFFRDKESMGYQLITQSVWGNNRELRLAMLPISSAYNMPSDEMMHMRKEQRNMLPKLGIENNEEAMYLGDLFARENIYNTYSLTANFVDYLLNESEERNYFDGVVYPSVPSEGLGMNICVRKELIDSGVVSCDGACTEMLIKNKMQSKLSHLYDCSVLPNGDLSWRISEMLQQAIGSPLLFPDLLFL